MDRIVSGVLGLGLFCGCIFGQQSSGLKSYKTPEDYCLDNPKAPTCIKIPKMNVSDLHPGMGNLSQRPVARPAVTSVGRETLSSPMVLQDWQFAHSSPAMLMVINVRSLAQSPLLATLFSAMGGAGARSQELDNMRAAVSDVGQILISTAANGGETPSTLMLVRGNIDGPLSSMLRSSPGTQSHRIDAFSMLVGDAGSVGLAKARLKSTVPRSSSVLLQTATLEGMKYDLWIGIDPRYLRTAGFGFGKTSGQEIDILSRLRGLSGGLYLRDQIRLEANVEAPSPEMAERMLGAYRDMEAQDQSPDNPFGKQIWASTEGAKLRFIAIADLSRIKETAGFHTDAAKMIGPQLGPLMEAITALGARKQAQAAAAPPQTQATPQTQTTTEPKAQQGIIVINGLAGGPREISVSK